MEGDEQGPTRATTAATVEREVRTLTGRVERLDREIQRLQTDRLELPPTRPIQLCPRCGFTAG